MLVIEEATATIFKVSCSQEFAITIQQINESIEETKHSSHSITDEINNVSTNMTSLIMGKKLNHCPGNLYRKGEIYPVDQQTPPLVHRGNLDPFLTHRH